jgi:uncharacterized protein involved in exopolysaccharide biosynthesis
MQDSIPHLIVKYRTSIIVTVLAAALLALGVSMLMPKQYLSSASLLPANSKMMDKQAMFGSNIQELYSAYGASEDLDRLMATLHSSAVLQQVVDSLQLQKHYAISGKDARKKALKKLQKQVKLSRSEYGEINIKAWDKDPVMAQRIVSLMLARTQQVYDDMFAGYYNRSLDRLEAEYRRASRDTAAGLSHAALNELMFLRDRIAEYKITRINPPAAMFVLAAPEVAELHDKPDPLMNSLLAAVAAMFTVLAWLAGNAFWKSAYAKP